MKFDFKSLDGDLEDFDIRIEGLHSLLEATKLAAAHPNSINVSPGLFLMELEASSLHDDLCRMRKALEKFINEETT